MLNSAKNILLASHGTIGAQVAEQKVFEMCVSSTHITHLLVVPEFWKNMLGDDWLNNSSTRKRFGDYLEAELSQEVDQHIERIHGQLDSMNISSTHKVILGDPEKCLLDICRDSSFDLVIMGSPRPKGMVGLCSRMATKPVTRELTMPLLLVPHPNA